MKIKEYKSISHMDIEDLDNTVNEFIEQGWQPIGGSWNTHFQCQDGKNIVDLYWHGQAMGKYEEEPLKTETKEKKAVDCFSAELIVPNNVHYVEKKYLDLNEGWETIYKDHSELKMVKYEI